MKISKAQIGNKNSWKGDNVGYRGIHHWIRKQLGKANYCQDCKLNKVPEDKKRYFQWSNISGKYLRDLKDWVQRCIPCHMVYDKNKQIKTPLTT